MLWGHLRFTSLLHNFTTTSHQRRDVQTPCLCPLVLHNISTARWQITWVQQHKTLLSEWGAAIWVMQCAVVKNATVILNLGSLENRACGNIYAKMSGAKSDFSFIRDRWMWVWQGFIMSVVLNIEAVILACFYASLSSFILTCVSQDTPHPSHTQCCTRWDSKQVYYIRIAIWSWLCDASVKMC